MTHFAIACPESPGHMNPMTTLLKELQQRGHEITWFGLADRAQLVRERGFRSVVIGEDEFPPGSYDSILRELGEKSGLDALRYTIESFRRGVQVGLDECPKLIRECGATALLADETVLSARSVAEQLQLPWISVCNALPMHPDPDLPPGGFGWTYGTTHYHRLRNRFGYFFCRKLMSKIDKAIRNFRTLHALPHYHLLRGNASRLATIAQISRQFDYPRQEQSDWFHYVGALHDASSRAKVEFPYERLNDQPLIYASMGTAQNRLYSIFHVIAEACRDVPAQLVISMGGGGRPGDLGPLAGNPIVVEFAPQLELIQRASLVITHAGMNTAAESIAHGVPMVAIPVTNDQPGVAARIVRAGCGLSVPLSKATASRVGRNVKQLLANERFSVRAKEMAAANRQAGGVKRAADLIEHVLEDVDPRQAFY